MTFKRLLAWGCGLPLAGLLLITGLAWATYKVSWSTYWMVHDTTGLWLPIGYETLDTYSSGFVMGDYEVSRKVSFDDDELADLVERIKGTPFYNQNPDDLALSKLKDEEMVGTWQRRSSTYVFFSANADGVPMSNYVFGEAWMVSCKVDLQTRTLSYTYIKI